MIGIQGSPPHTYRGKYAAAPATAVSGDIYYNTTNNLMYLYNGTSWNALGAGVGQPITGGTQGSVLFAGVGGNLAQDNANFFWDDTANQLRINIASASAPSYSFIGDPDTGVYNKGANRVGFSGGGADILELVHATSAINYVKITNAATGARPIIEADGTNTNVGLTFKFKGSANYHFLSGLAGQFTQTQLVLYEAQDYGTNTAIIQAPQVMAGNSLLTLPDNTTATLVGDTTTQTLTNKTLQNNNGSSSAPPYSFISEQNTGIYRPSANNIGFSVAGSLRMSINGSTGTYNLANFTDPGNGVNSANMVGGLGVLIHGYVTHTPNTVTDQTQTFQVETGVGTGVFTTVQVVGSIAAATNVGGAVVGAFSLFVPTGRKWKHNQVGTATVTSISAITI